MMQSDVRDVRVYGEAGNVVERREYAGEIKEW
jgi:hypothetical protein